MHAWQSLDIWQRYGAYVAAWDRSFVHSKGVGLDVVAAWSTPPVLPTITTPCRLALTNWMQEQARLMPSVALPLLHFS